MPWKSDKFKEFVKNQRELTPSPIASKNYLFIGFEYIIQGWLQEFLEINPKPKIKYESESKQIGKNLNQIRILI